MEYIYMFWIWLKGRFMKFCSRHQRIRFYRLTRKRTRRHLKRQKIRQNHILQRHVKIIRHRILHNKVAKGEIRTIEAPAIFNIKKMQMTCFLFSMM